MRSTEKWSVEVRDREAVHLSTSVCFALDGKEDETPKTEALGQVRTVSVAYTTVGSPLETSP